MKFLSNKIQIMEVALTSAHTALEFLLNIHAKSVHCSPSAKQMKCYCKDRLQLTQFANHVPFAFQEKERLTFLLLQHKLFQTIFHQLIKLNPYNQICQNIVTANQLDVCLDSVLLHQEIQKLVNWNAQNVSSVQLSSACLHHVKNQMFGFTQE